MRLHHAALRVGQLAGLEKDGVRDANLADVVDLRGEFDHLHLWAVETKPARDGVRVDRDTLRVLICIRVTTVDLVGHALHRPHRVAADLDALAQRVVGQDSRHHSERQQPRPPGRCIRRDGADQVQDRELGENDLLRRAHDREGVARRAERDGGRDEDVVGDIEGGRGGDHRKRVLPAVDSAAGCNACGQKHEARRPG